MTIALFFLFFSGIVSWHYYCMCGAQLSVAETP